MSPLAVFDWQRQSKAMTTSRTTSLPAYSGHYYMYLDSPSQTYGDMAILELPTSNTYTGEACLSFHYLSHGEGVGELAVYSLTDNRDLDDGRLIWREWGISEATWNKAVVPLHVSQDNRVVFAATVGESRTSTLALDSIQLSIDMTECEALRTNSCSDESMGPHDITCLVEIWQEFCLPSGLGNPLNNLHTRETADLGTLRNFWWTIHKLSRGANSRDEYDLLSCYGEPHDYIRLSHNGKTSGIDRGRLEVFRSGSWGTVCDDSFDKKDADTACQHLGFISGQARTDAYFGEGTGPIMMTNLGCDGESKLYKCDHRHATGRWRCGHSEDVGVICQEALKDISMIGASEIVPRPHMDTTQNAIFLPATFQKVKKTGFLQSWHLYAEIQNQVFLQAWKLERTEMSYSSYYEVYKLIFQMKVNLDVGKHNHTINFRTISRTRIRGLGENIVNHQRILLEEGSILGLFFPESNPIPYSNKDCYSMEEQLRYSTDLDKEPVLGELYSFRVAPMSWGPCRDYSFKAVIDIPDDQSTSTQTSVVHSTNTTTLAPRLPGTIFSCDFDTDLCGMHQDSSDQFDWTRISGHTPTYSTGPHQAHAGEYYIYAEASGRRSNDEARISTPWLSLFGHGCLTFYYSMDGLDIRGLTVFEENKMSTHLADVWSRAGPVYGQWNRAVIDLTANGSVKYHIDATIGRSALGDIAIDSITLLNTTCEILKEKTPTIATPTQGMNISSRTYYVSMDGFDSAGCGSVERPCQTFRPVLTDAAEIKTVLLNNSFGEHVYGLDLSAFGSSYSALTINGLADFDDQNQDNVSILQLLNMDMIHLRQPEVQHQLLFNGVHIQGSINIACNQGVVLLGLQNSVVTSNTLTEIEVSLCNGLELLVENTRFIDAMLRVSSNEYSKVKFNNVVMIGTTASMDSGVLIEGNAVNSKLNIELDHCVFRGAGHQLHKNLPGAAFAVQTAEKSSELKLFVANTQFLSNQRGMDIAVKGEVVMEITSSVFFNNTGDGSGGALRVAGYMLEGLRATTDVAEARLIIRNCTFESNVAYQSTVYTEADYYFKTRSPGSGGAIFVYLSPPSTIEQYGLLEISDSVFLNNSCESHGGAIFVNSDISSHLLRNRMENSRVTSTRAKIGNLIYATNTMDISAMNISVTFAQPKTSIIFYEAADSLENSLHISSLNLVCTQGYMVEKLIGASAKNIQSLQIYCRSCPENTYSIEKARIFISGINSELNPSYMSCKKCPYGAKCQNGILNRKDFWGTITNTGDVNMHMCPEGYCDIGQNSPVDFSVCAAHRTGILCGKCTNGYSESLFSPECVSNSDCGMQHWYILFGVAIYGLLYFLFFFFEREWSRFFGYTIRLMNRRCNKDFTQRTSSSAIIVETGYFQIFMYFIQAAALLTINIVLEDDAAYQYVKRPTQLMPQFLVNGIEMIFNFEFPLLYEKSCLMTDVTPVQKVFMKLAFFAYVYILMLFVYIVSGFCCVCILGRKHPRLSGIGLNLRMFLTAVSLFLYTYQEIAQLTLSLLNCREVGDKSVLFYDGNIECVQGWQYAVIAMVCIFVIPFFTVLLLGPKLLKDREISLRMFICSLCFPLFTSPIMIWKFVQSTCMVSYRVHHTNSSLCSSSESGSGLTPPVNEELEKSDRRTTQNPLYGGGIAHHSVFDQNKNQLTNQELKSRTARQPTIQTEKNYNNVNVSTSRLCAEDRIVYALSGPYRDEIMGGLCYNGIMNFRRLILVILFTFIKDHILRQMMMSFACLLFLALHFKLSPFKQQTANRMETRSLTLLVLLSGINLVRASFIYSGTIPRGESYLVLVLSEWLEACCFGLLPLALAVVMFVAVCYHGGKRLCCRQRPNKFNYDCNYTPEQKRLLETPTSEDTRCVVKYKPPQRSPYYAAHITNRAEENALNSLQRLFVNSGNDRTDFECLSRQVSPDDAPLNVGTPPARGLLRTPLRMTPDGGTYYGANRRWYPTYLAELNQVTSGPSGGRNTDFLSQSVIQTRRLGLYVSPVSNLVPPLDRQRSRSDPARRLFDD